MFDECTENPEVAWGAIRQLARTDLNEEEIGLLAAGPVETLLCWHGEEFIDRIVEEARKNPILNKILGGVWRSDMPEAVWKCIEGLRRSVW
jgi:hypothetical protein